MRPIHVVCIAMTIAAGSAFAQAMDADTDGDGMVTYDELIAAYPDVTEDDFASMDSDGSGSLDEAEMTAAIEAGSLESEDG